MQAWNDFLKLLESDFGEETVSKWLRTLKILKFDATNLYLQAEDQFQALWFEEHVRIKASKSFLNNNQSPIKIHLQVLKENSTQLSSVPFGKESLIYPSDPTRKEALFEHYIPSDENKMAFDVLSHLCLPSENPSKVAPGDFNPILIYGPKESGKTHLLMAAQLSMQKLGLRSRYVRADTFTDHVIRAIRNGNMIEFRKIYRNLDVLIVDDLEILSGKAATQEEFFHTYNTLHTEGKQIILSSSVSPKFFVDIEPRLISRFEWGLTIPIKPLTEKGLISLVDHQLKKYIFSFDDTTKSWLASNFTKPSHLLKALDIIKFRSQLASKKHRYILPLETVHGYLKDYLFDFQQIKASPHRILEELAINYKVKVDDLLGKSQAREHTIPRQIAMYICRLFLKMPYTKIGVFFSRDHSTVIASVRHVELSIKNDSSEFLPVIQELCRKVGIA